VTGEWKECKLGDIVSSNKESIGKNYPFQTILYLDTGSITRGKIDSFQEYELSKAPSRAKRLVKNNVIVYSTVRPIQRHYGFIVNPQENLVVSTGFAVIEVKEHLAAPLFIFYFLTSDEIVETLDVIAEASTSAYPSLKSSDIEALDLLLPPLPEQHAIASVLSSLDDKIDLLHRQNKTLEAMAETLFRQWFVEEVDEEWEEVDLEYVTEKITDGAHKSPPTVEVGLPMASVKDMHQWGIHLDSCRKISESDFEELVRNDCRPLKNDILIAKDGSYLKHVFVAPKDLDLVILSSIAILRPNGKYHPILLSIYLKMSSTREALENIVTGAVIPRIVLKDFRKFKLKLPPMELQVNALKTLEPIHTRCWQNVNQIRSLEKLRDTLLPKLMSGEVKVEV
jgi:type I restriction enzyme S subunit